MYKSSSGIGCLNGSITCIGSGIEGSIICKSDSLKGYVSHIGGELNGAITDLNREINGAIHRVGGSLTGSIHLICTISKDFYLRVEPDYVWLTPDMLSGEFDIYSNVNWKID